MWMKQGTKVKGIQRPSREFAVHEQFLYGTRNPRRNWNNGLKILIASYCSFSFIYAAFIFMVFLLLMVSFQFALQHAYSWNRTVNNRSKKSKKSWNFQRTALWSRCAFCLIEWAFFCRSIWWFSTLEPFCASREYFASRGIWFCLFCVNFRVLPFIQKNIFANIFRFASCRPSSSLDLHI